MPGGSRRFPNSCTNSACRRARGSSSASIRSSPTAERCGTSTRPCWPCRATHGLRRYDKIHRMIFGEYIPARDWLPFLKAVVPFEPGFELAAGDRAVAYDYKQWRLCPSICFEDTVPHLMRTLVQKLEAPTAGAKPVDCLVNITNDGWFHGSAGLDQHLITALFRCVELRKPMVRAANTGISAVIDGDGMVIEPDVYIDADNKGRTSMRDPKTGRWNRRLNAVLVDSIPLDNRT